MQSRIVDLGGPVHYADFGGSGPGMVLVHGLGGSHANWLAVGEVLAERARVVAPDLAGFGLTPPARRASSTISANRELLDVFIDKVIGGPAILVGNSMGGLLALVEAAVVPTRVAGLVLVAPAQPLPRGSRVDAAVWMLFALTSIPGVSGWFMRRRAARLGAAGLVGELLKICCVDASRIPADVVEAHVTLAEERLARMPWANSALHVATRSLMTELRRRQRFAELIAKVTAPTLLIQGTGDRLVPLAASQAVARLRPDWTFVVFEDIGHVPQLEAAKRFADTVGQWLDGPGAPAIAAARSFPS
jgi:pimeloyl-ACP methyl ester carboxylesterase